MLAPTIRRALCGGAVSAQRSDRSSPAAGRQDRWLQVARRDTGPRCPVSWARDTEPGQTGTQGVTGGHTGSQGIIRDTGHLRTPVI